MAAPNFFKIYDRALRMVHQTAVGAFMNTYCVVLRPPSLLCFDRSRTRRCYLRADTADWAIHLASNDNPEWRVLGIEPGDLAAPLLKMDSSRPAPDAWHAA